MYCFLVPQFVSPFAWLFSHRQDNLMVLIDTVSLDYWGWLLLVNSRYSQESWLILFILPFAQYTYISCILVTKLIARTTLNLSWSELKVVVLRNLILAEILKIHDVWKWSIDIISGSANLLTSCSLFRSKAYTSKIKLYQTTNHFRLEWTAVNHYFWYIINCSENVCQFEICTWTSKSQL